MTKEVNILLDKIVSNEPNEFIIANPQTDFDFGMSVFCIIRKVDTKNKTIKDIDAGKIDISDKITLVNLKDYKYED